MRTRNGAVRRGLPGAVASLAVVIILWLWPGGLWAQRHGRADSVQQYDREPPEATLAITADHDHRLMRQQDFANLRRTTRAVAGRKPGSVRTYTGVLLADLVVADPSVSRYDIHHGFFHTMHLDNWMLPSPPDWLVADVVDGRTIKRELLFELIATTHDGRTIEIGRVTSIVLQRGSKPRP